MGESHAAKSLTEKRSSNHNRRQALMAHQTPTLPVTGNVLTNDGARPIGAVFNVGEGSRPCFFPERNVIGALVI